MQQMCVCELILFSMQKWHHQTRHQQTFMTVEAIIWIFLFQIDNTFPAKQQYFALAGFAPLPPPVRLYSVILIRCCCCCCCISTLYDSNTSLRLNLHGKSVDYAKMLPFSPMTTTTTTKNGESKIFEGQITATASEENIF